MNPYEAGLMLRMMTGTQMEELTEDELDVWEPLLDSFKDFCLSI